MNKIYYFTVGGKAVGKERPRMGRGKHFYTPQKTRDYENKIKLCFRQLYPLLNDDEHKWRLEIWTNREGVTVRATATGKNEPRYIGADGDNILKIVQDALQGLLWHNDGQITEAHVHLENQK
jgi:Holliday junction resolvase RusA-like endonuclease